jgi:hypothetical protein
MHPKTRRSIGLFVGSVEIVIGVSTLVTCFLAQVGILGLPAKQNSVYIFVMASASASFVLGAGMLAAREWARVLLVFFSGYIVLTKFLIFLGLMSFNGEIIGLLPSTFKNLVSVAYHLFIVITLTVFVTDKDVVKKCKGGI